MSRGGCTFRNWEKLDCVVNGELCLHVQVSTWLVDDAITLDDEGVDLTGADAARRLAFEALGPLLIDTPPESSPGWIAIEVRDQLAVTVLVSATIVVEQL